jgi:hypothetical protein
MPTYSPKGRSKPSIILTVKEAEIFKRYEVVGWKKGGFAFIRLIGGN